MMFSMTLGLEEMSIGIVVDIFERFPSTNMDCARKGLLNQSNFLSMVVVGYFSPKYKLVGIT